MPNNKASHPVTFRIKRSPKTKQFYFVTEGGNGEPTSTGETCKNRRDVQTTIERHIDAILDGRVEIKDDTGLPALKPKHYEGHLNRNFP